MAFPPSADRCRPLLCVSLRQLPSLSSFFQLFWLAFPYPLPVASRSRAQAFVWFCAKTNKKIVCLAHPLHCVTVCISSNPQSRARCATRCKLSLSELQLNWIQSISFMRTKRKSTSTDIYWCSLDICCIATIQLYYAYTNIHENIINW